MSLTALLLVIFNADGSPATQTKKNLEILEQLYSALFAEAFSSLPGDTICVIEKLAAPVDYAWVIENQLYKGLLKVGVRQIHANASLDNSMRVLYKPVEQTISYDRVGKKELERKISVAIFCQVTDSQNRLHFSELLQRTHIDSVAGPAKDLENARLSFTSGQQKKSLFAALYEPVLIIATTGVVIFLFYSYRSQ
ncbi:hypothetical protein JXA02_13505 [candidate division KSB1 bacterium]|nr:hypothetical protein [candidate division KSB1 bacterium]RQW01392.1 MAG: hypothetical protein EH222_15245 [candidate division KSB1 bacterium]